MGKLGHGNLYIAAALVGVLLGAAGGVAAGAILTPDLSALHSDVSSFPGAHLIPAAGPDSPSEKGPEPPSHWPEHGPGHPGQDAAATSASIVQVTRPVQAAVSLVAIAPVCGDVTLDEAASILDTVAMLQMTSGQLQPDPAQRVLGDLKRDGAIDVFDAILSLQQIVGLVEITECGVTPSSPPFAPALPP